MRVSPGCNSRTYKAAIPSPSAPYSVTAPARRTSAIR
jgi:hypothetical protein